MTQRFTIGRLGDQPFRISDEFNGVSREHARIIIGEDGRWTIEDIKGPAGNGTFVRELTGEWRPVLKAEITPQTMVRLGQFHSFTFMAHRVLQKPGEYTYELKQMLKLWHALTADIEAEQHRLDRRKKILLGLTIGGVAIAAGGGWVFPALGITGGVGGLGSGIMMARMMMSPDSKRLTELRTRRARLVTCPSCGRAMSETDVNNLMCSICKAK